MLHTNNFGCIYTSLPILLEFFLQSLLFNPFISECGVPARHDVDYGKLCPSPGTCLNGNFAYETLTEAWKKCGTMSECGFVSHVNGKFYLRRLSDPDNGVSAGIWGYTYKTCRT